MIDWSEAGRVAGIGFGVVFLVLCIIALAVQAVGAVLRRLGPRFRGSDSRPAQGKKD